MAANHNLPGRSRLYISGTGRDGVALRFYPSPSRRVNEIWLTQAFKVLDHADAEDALKNILPASFCREAEYRGFSLVECVKEAKSLLLVSDGSSESLMTDDQLAGVLANLVPDMDPDAVLVHLRRNLRARGKVAVKILREYEARFGRDGENGSGYIRLSDPNSQLALP